MTSISSVNNAALLILRQANASTLANDSDVVTATDKITAIVNGVSSEDSTVKTQASSKINSGLLDVKQANDNIVSNALDFIDSESFQSSDPTVKGTLKQLICEDGDKFAALVKAEKAKSPGISDDNAVANAVQGLIKNNRDSFSDGEFVVGVKLSGGGAILANIEDRDGNSTGKTLRADVQAQYASLTAATEALLAADADDPEALKAVSAGLNNHKQGEALNALSNWNTNWLKAFGFD